LQKNIKVLLYHLLLTTTVFCSFLLSVSKVQAVKAFPEAEGFGANTIGGRGGRVIEVTNLNDSGIGSLRQCAQVEIGPRICVFRVAGNITLNSDIDIVNPYLTIAGQSAPGGGITLKAANQNSTVHIQIRTPQVILRYIRSRPGTKIANSRALSINNPQNTVNNVIVDHNSFSWAGDELTITWLATNRITYQWNIASESIGALKGPSFGEDGGGYFSVHHNLIAHHSQRLPQVSASGGPVDIRNNLIYNPGGLGSVIKNGAHANYVANFIKSGPNTSIGSWIMDGGDKGPAVGYFVAGNVLQGISRVNSALNEVSHPFPTENIVTTTAEAAYERVLNEAGAYRGVDCNGSWFIRRDTVDARVIQSVRDGTRGHAGSGYITDPSEVGGWPNLTAGVICPDNDKDGMPNDFESRFGFNLNSNDGTLDADNDGYTNIEEYLNVSNPKGPDRDDVTIPSPTFNPGNYDADINNDGVVNVVDISIIIDNYTRSGSNIADINTDGKVDIIDIGIAIDNYSL
jgi:pectate lyase